jgi:hypothetical protein
MIALKKCEQHLTNSTLVHRNERGYAKCFADSFLKLSGCSGIAEMSAKWQHRSVNLVCKAITLMHRQSKLHLLPYG